MQNESYLLTSCRIITVIEKQIERLTHSQNELYPNLGNWFIDINFAKT